MGFPAVTSSERQVSVQAIETKVFKSRSRKEPVQKIRSFEPVLLVIWFAREPNITKACCWDGLARNSCSYYILPESMCFIDMAYSQGLHSVFLKGI